MSAYEQNTQQSPCNGRKTAPQAGHSQKNWQASRGMRAYVADPHDGHAIMHSYRTGGTVGAMSGDRAVGAAPSQVAATALGVASVFSSRLAIVTHRFSADDPTRADRQRRLAGRIRSQSAVRIIVTSPA